MEITIPSLSIGFLILLDVIFEGILKKKGILRRLIMFLRKKDGIRKGIWPVEVKIKGVNFYEPTTGIELLYVRIILHANEDSELGSIYLRSTTMDRQDTMPSSYHGTDKWIPFTLTSVDSTKNLCFNFPSPQIGEKFILVLQTSKHDCWSKEYTLTSDVILTKHN